MKKRLKKTVLSYLVCIATLVYSAIPVQAMGPDTCQHRYFADSVELLPTGVYDYRSDGHYAEHSRIKTCLNCGYEIFSNTTFLFESPHEFPKIWSDYDGHNFYYNCTTVECPKQLVLSYEII